MHKLDTHVFTGSMSYNDFKIKIKLNWNVFRLQTSPKLNSIHATVLRTRCQQCLKPLNSVMYHYRRKIRPRRWDALSSLWAWYYYGRNWIRKNVEFTSRNRRNKLVVIILIEQNIYRGMFLGKHANDVDFLYDINVETFCTRDPLKNVFRYYLIALDRSDFSYDTLKTRITFRKSRKRRKTKLKVNKTKLKHNTLLSKKYIFNAPWPI